MTTRPASPSGEPPAKRQKREHRYYREDFTELVTAPVHLDLVVDVLETRVTVVARTTFEHRGSDPLSTLALNCKQLEVIRVARVEASPLGSSKDFPAHVASFGTSTPLKYEVDTVDHFLNVTLDTPVLPGGEVVIETETTARPTASTLEGLYYDYTPAGKPQTIITQCQQWGFQRICPSIDTMTAKAYYTTTIVADERYTNVITNGDLAPQCVDEATGHPVYGPGDEVTDEKGNKVQRRKICYYNHEVCMAPYLFFLGVGTYVTYRRTCEYPDGDTFLLELLVFPDIVEGKDARAALAALHDSIIWVNTSCGPEAAEHAEQRARLHYLLQQREAIKASGGELCTASTEPMMEYTLSSNNESKLAAVREELKALVTNWGGPMGYKYTGAIYREIAMENSDFGGMENVGNTTILSSRLVPSSYMSDGAYIYMEGVKAHEFYHNINGSQVTGQSPFEIWLNEAVTVHIERQRVASLFGEEFTRLLKVMYAFMPATGPLDADKSATAMSIEPDGFNRTQELISSVTYSKAPEFVRMVELLIGKPAFNRGLDAYHTKFKDSNASTADWVASMAAAGNVDLTAMADGWLKKKGHPILTLHSTSFDATTSTYTATFSQRGVPEAAADQVWVIPIDWALVRDGANDHEGVFVLSTKEAVLTVTGVTSAPDFISVARSWSFFGVVDNQAASPAQLRTQALTDPDTVNRLLAYRAVVDQSKNAMIKALAAGEACPPLPEAIVELHATILFDTNLDAGSRSCLLSESESAGAEELAHYYEEIARARSAVLAAFCAAHSERIMALFSELAALPLDVPQKEHIGERRLKQHCFRVLRAGAQAKQAVDVEALLKHARTMIDSPFMEDRKFGLQQYLELAPAGDARTAVRNKVRDGWKAHPVAWEEYIRVLSTLDAEDAPQQIREIMEDDAFDLTLAGHSRTVARGWASLRKRSLLHPAGLSLLCHICIQVGKVNQMSAYSILQAFNDLAKFDSVRKQTLCDALKQIHAALDPVKEESLYNRINTIIDNA